MTKAQKSAYNRKWYLANKSYKKTYSRLRNRGLYITAKDIVFDRQQQVVNGRWLDERDGMPYLGIKIV